MIKVICKDNQIVYNAYHLVKAFFPDGEVESEVCEENTCRIELISVNDNTEELILSAEDIHALYEGIHNITGKDLPWGMLTGVRPTKLATKWIEENMYLYQDENDAREAFIKWFYEERFVSREKAITAFNVARTEQKLMTNAMKGGYSLYIGIPFCPSVCSYCSFSSGAISEYEDRVEEYLKALFNEMQEKAESYKGIYPTTIYFGGGTPTSISAEQLDALLGKADELFDIKGGLKSGQIQEYTVEAGRPDSITREKLLVLKKHGITRISINPQSMQQKTLDIIGRRHTVEEIRDTFQLARELGFDNINMDIIAGLPGEDNRDVNDTLRQIMEMKPDSLTVHSLAVKRSSKIGIAKKTGKSTEAENASAADIGRMIADAREAAEAMGMKPYYLYRQKSIAGNFENVGYACPGKEGLYNILIMEEVQSIIACGAGASNKIVTEEAVPNPKRKGQMTHLIRSENVKNIDDYIKKYNRK